MRRVGRPLCKLGDRERPAPAAEQAEQQPDRERAAPVDELPVVEVQVDNVRQLKLAPREHADGVGGGQLEQQRSGGKPQPGG